MSPIKLDERYRLLDAMGIPYWVPRLPHSSVLISKNPIFSAVCLVLLPEDPKTLNLDADKILKGMLKVLELPAEEICIAWINHTLSVNSNSLKECILKWAPLSVLAMGETVTHLLIGHKNFDISRENTKEILNATLQVTYHPSELQVSPADKSKAYRDLLCLKEKIFKVRAI